MTDAVSKLKQQARDYTKAADILAPVGDRMSLAIREVIDLLECGGSGD